MTKASLRYAPAALALLAALWCAPGAGASGMRAADPWRVARPVPAVGDIVTTPLCEGFHLGNSLEARGVAPGRPWWLSRDPLGERGGLNLYGFVGNDPVNKVDYLGLDHIYVHDNGWISWVITDPDTGIGGWNQTKVGWHKIGKVGTRRVKGSGYNPLDGYGGDYDVATAILDSGGTMDLSKVESFVKGNPAEGRKRRYHDTWHEDRDWRNSRAAQSQIISEYLGELGAGSEGSTLLRKRAIAAASRNKNEAAARQFRATSFQFAAGNDSGGDIFGGTMATISPLPLVSGGKAWNLFRASNSAFAPAAKTGFPLVPQVGNMVDGLAQVRIASNEIPDMAGNLFTSTRPGPNGAHHVLRGWFREARSELYVSWYSTTLRRHGIGTEMLSNAIEATGAQRLAGQLGDFNRKYFDDLVSGGAAVDDAVWATPIGRSAEKLGFTTLEFNPENLGFVFGF